MSEIPNNSTPKENLQVEKNKDFEKLWILYGKIGNKKQAQKAFLKVTKDFKVEIIEDGIKNYLKHLESIKTNSFYPIKHFSTWLNNEGWLDEYNFKPIDFSLDENQTHRSDQNNTLNVKNESNVIEGKNNAINLFKNDNYDRMGIEKIDVHCQEKPVCATHYEVLTDFYQYFIKVEFVHQSYDGEGGLPKYRTIERPKLINQEDNKGHLEIIKANLNLYMATIGDIIGCRKNDEALNKILVRIEMNMRVFFAKEIKQDANFLHIFLLKINNYNFICVDKVLTLDLPMLYHNRGEMKCSREAFFDVKYNAYYITAKYMHKVQTFKELLT